MSTHSLAVCFAAFTACVVSGTAFVPGRAAEPAPAAGITITDGNGETVVLKSATVTAGTRRLAWLADPKGASDSAKKGPEAFELREPGSSAYVQGVLTLVPMTSIESLRYDFDKKVVQLKAAGLDAPLLGTLEYQGFNVISLDAEVDKGTAGIAVVKYRGGQAKGGIRGVTFSGAAAFKPAAPTAPVEWSVQILDAKAKNPVITVNNLEPLYRFPDGSEKIIRTLPFQKTLKLDWAEIRGLKHEPATTKGQAAEIVVTMKDGKEQTLTPLSTLEVDNKKANLLGLIGDVPGAYKLIPLHTILELKPRAAN